MNEWQLIDEIGKKATSLSFCCETALKLKLNLNPHLVQDGLLELKDMVNKLKSKLIENSRGGVKAK